VEYDDHQLVLTIVIAESALQLVPGEIQSHSQIKQYAQRRGKQPNEVLLDRAFHHAAMLKLARRVQNSQVERMGRPDIVHNTLLQILETPLNWERQLRVILHTQDGQVITINPRIRLPKNYVRFVGLIEQLLSQGKVPAQGEPLMQVEKKGLNQILRPLGADKMLGLSILGKPILMRTLADQVAKSENPVAFIGGFPRGHFTEQTRKLVDEVCCVDSKPLDAWVVAGRFVYDFEWAIGVAQGRIEPKKG
jgi:rRNA small subunit pseudouridine methyltransferase Nep1